jgi:rhamnosyltransferase
MKYSAIVVVYKPTEDDLLNIQRLQNEVPVLIIVDNDKAPSLSLQDKFGENYVFNGNEFGLAGALIKGLEKARQLIDDGWCFLLDQDSRLDENFFDEMLYFRDSFSDDNVAIYASNFFDVNSKTYAKFSYLNKFNWRSFSVNENSKPQVSSFAITSGSLISLSWYHKLGGFKKEFFIDHIDSEYCVRAQKAGAKIVINPKVTIRHAIGVRTVHKLLGLTIKPNNHNHIRKYYIVRNGLYSSIVHFRSYPSFLILNLARICHEVLAVLIYEKDKVRKLKAMFLGALAGLTGRLGKCPL